MATDRENLLQHRVFHHFHQICQIPHGSGNEKALSDYILAWAKDLGLEASQDAVNNLLIRKPAKGLPDAPVTMLQAHLDMVCEKAQGVAHDFTRDPIGWMIEGDMLSTGGKTTLGADNGIGVSLAMAVLESDDLPHPTLEVLFTVNEEDDFTGASSFAPEALRASYLINLDHAREEEVVCGSSGGMQVDVHLPVHPVPIPAGWRAFCLSVSGLKGGHSGEDIHLGRGSANGFMARLLLGIEACCDFLLCELQGGSYRLAIPREAKALLWLDPANLPVVEEALRQLEGAFRRELALTGHGVQVALTPTQSDLPGVSPAGVIDALTLIPDGIYQMNEAFIGLVDTSDNLGEVYLNEKELHLVLELRSATDSLRTYLYQRIERLAHLLGGECSWSNPYPSWQYAPDSKLLEKFFATYTALRGKPPVAISVHCGLEVGFFCKKKPSLEAISIGPDCWNFHSPAETVSISSVKRTYECFCQTLAALG